MRPVAADDDGIVPPRVVFRRRSLLSLIGLCIVMPAWPGRAVARTKAQACVLTADSMTCDWEDADASGTYRAGRQPQ